MLFLLRLIFWMLLICLLLPSSHGSNGHLMTSAERTVNDVRGFCQRNPDVCDDARVTMTSMLSRLKSGADLVQTWLSKGEEGGSGSNGSAARPRAAAPAPAEASPAAETEPVQPPRLILKWQNSLSSKDKQVPWHDPTQL